MRVQQVRQSFPQFEERSGRTDTTGTTSVVVASWSIACAAAALNCVAVGSILY